MQSRKLCSLKFPYIDSSECEEEVITFDFERKINYYTLDY